MRMDDKDERILLALQEGPKRLKEIASMLGSRRTAKRRTAKLIKYGLLKRIRQGIYALTSKGKAYVKKQTASEEMLSIGQDLWDTVSTFIRDKVPTEVYQAVVRLALSELRAKQSELFSNLKNQFSGGWSGVLLGGKPKAIKTPLAELICGIAGLNLEKQKFPTTATKSELGAAYQEGGAWRYRPSPWHKEPFIIFDDWHRIITKDTRETILSLAQGNRTFRRYGETFINHPVPFIALNTHTRSIPETTEKIIREVGEEYVKRLVTVNVDCLAPYLEDAAILARKMLRSVPRLNFKAFPLRKKELTDGEFRILCDLLKEATKPEKREFFDERSVELLVLGRYALAKGQDIIGTIYQTCWDRLLCLQTLGAVRDGWRKSFRKKWKEYVATEQPKVLEKLKEEEEKEKEWRRRAEKTREEREEKEVKKREKKARQALAFKRRKGELEANLKQLRDGLPSPQMKKGGWGNRQIPLREQINTLLSWVRGAKTEEKLQICESQYPEVKSECQDFMRQYRSWERKQEGERTQKEQAEKALKATKNKLIKPFQDLRKEFNKFRLKEEKSIVEEAKNLIDEMIKRIQEAKGIQGLEKMQAPVSTPKSILDYLEGKRISLSFSREELELKLEILKQRRELAQEVQNCRKKLNKFNRQEEKEAVQEKKQILEDLLSKIYQSKAKTDLPVKDVNVCKQEIDSLIVHFKRRRAEQETQKKSQKEAQKEQSRIQSQVKKIQKEKKKIKEQRGKDVFRKEDLFPKERVLFDKLQEYKQRKTAPTDDLGSFSERLGIVRKVNSWDRIQAGPNRGRTYREVFSRSYLNRFRDFFPSQVYFAIDGKVYPLDHFKNWDQVKTLIHTGIEQFYTLAKGRRQQELTKRWNKLNEEEQKLTSSSFV